VHSCIARSSCCQLLGNYLPHVRFSCMLWCEQTLPGTCADANSVEPGAQPYSCPTGSVLDPSGGTITDLSDDMCCLVSRTVLLCTHMCNSQAQMLGMLHCALSCPLVSVQ
jgi:hypothetical protein